MRLNSCPSEQQLSQFHLGNLPEPELSAVAEHLEGCPRCETRHRQLDTSEDSLLQALRDVPYVEPDTAHQETEAVVVKPAPPPADLLGQFPFLQPPLAPDEAGRLGQFRILRLIGQGGMGFVFHAEDSLLHRPVALKVMKPSTTSTAEWRQRFMREARILASLQHKNLVSVFQVGQENDVCYLVMELLQGQSMESWVGQHGPAQPSMCLRLAYEMAAGLDAVHQRGLVHRDIKPGNIWLESPGERVKLIDFGLARAIEDESHLTQSGLIVGTPAFMSPEQARGGPIDARSDLFSLGSVLYFLCTGSAPFQGPSATAVLLALAAASPQPVRAQNPAIPRALSDMIGQLLEKDPARRPPSAAGIVARFRAPSAPSSISTAEPAAESTGDIPTRIGPAKVPEEAVPPVPMKPIPAVSKVSAPNVSRSVKPEKLQRPQADTAAESAGGLRKRKKRGERQTESHRREQILIAVVVFLAVVSVIVYLKFSKNSHAEPEPTNTAEQTPADKTSKQATQSSDPSPKSLLPPLPLPPGKGTFLSALEDIRSKAKAFPFLPPPDKKDGPPLGTLVSVNRTVSPHGIFMHPVPDGSCSASYKLDGRYRKFQAQVSLNDTSKGPESPMIFVVYGDGKVLWKSKVVNGPDDTQNCEITVEGVKVLKLEVQCQGATNGAHGVWVEPYLAQ